MADAILAFNEFSFAWLATMVEVVWQSAALVVIAAAVMWACRGLSPAVRCWAWRVVAIKLLIMPVWTVSVPTPWWLADSTVPAVTIGNETSNAPAVFADANVSVERRTNDVDSFSPLIAGAASVQLNWCSWLAVIWLAVIAIQLSRLGWQRLLLRRLLAAVRFADAATNRRVADGCRQLGLARVPAVLVTNEDVSPFVCGWSRPLLVLPGSLLAAGEPFQLQQIVLHELAHLRRRDLAWCWITQVVRMVYWFHPAVHWVAFRESLERELACDELAMAHSGATPADYARTLIAAAGRLAQPAGLRALTAAHSDGGYRLQLIATRQKLAGRDPQRRSAR